MKKTSLIILSIVLYSCLNSSETIEKPNTIETRIIGKVSDFERDIPIENFKIVLLRFWDDWSGVHYYLGREYIDSVRTNANGEYSLTFDFVEGEEYGFEKQYYGIPYYTKRKCNSSIVGGNINTCNIDAWKPSVLELSLKVKNNNNPPMRINNHNLEDEYLNFPRVSIFKQQIDTIIYLKNKPNSKSIIEFYYNIGYNNGTHFKYSDQIETALLDTLKLSYEIDCSTF
jgi:hypothetical protein